MRQSSERWTRRVNPPLVIVAGTLTVLLAAAVAAARAQGAVGPAEVLVVVLLLSTLGALVVSRIRAGFAEPSTTEAAAFGRTYSTELSPAGIALVIAYLRRVRRYRAVAAWVMGPTAYVLLLAGPHETGTGVKLSLAAMLALGFSGSFVGAVLAEAYNVRRRRFDGPRLASLDARHLSIFLPSRERRRVAVVACAVVATAVGCRLVGWSGTTSALVVVVPAAGVLAVVELLQHHVVNRHRPAMSPDLVEADDAIRMAAIRHGLSTPGLCLELLLLFGSLLPVTHRHPWIGVASLGCLIAAAVVWFRVPRFLAGERLPSPVPA